MDTSETMTSSSGGRPAVAPNAGTLQKRSMRIAGHRTSLALEQEFWAGLEKIARSRNLSLPMLIASIDSERAQRSPDASLASAVRVFVLENRL